jgi:hypothetical protein
MLVFAYGQLTAINETEGTNVLSYRPFIEQIDVEVIFVLPGYAIDDTRPPRAIENTAKVLFSDLLTIAGDFFYYQHCIP